MIKSLIKMVFGLCLIATLSGCATYFERSAQKHCYRGDWLAHGFDAGKRGKDFNTEWQANDHRCAEYNLWSDKRDYQQGYALGKAAFCEIDNGFEFGIRNKHYNAICDTSTQQAFDRAYDDGQRLRRARRNVDYYAAELDRTLNLIDYASYRRRELADEINSGDLDKDLEKKYVKERYKLKKRREYAVYNLPNCRAQLRDAETRARLLSQELSEYYDVYGQESAQNYSVNQKIKSENRLIPEPAIIVYSPRKPANKEAKRQALEITSLTRYVSENFSRGFRYQVLDGGELSLLNSQGEETKVNLQTSYQNRARVLFWNPKTGLSVKTVTMMVELAPLVKNFIQKNDTSTLATLSSTTVTPRHIKVKTFNEESAVPD